MSDNFKDIVSRNSNLQAAFHSFTDKIIAEAKSEWGIDLDKAALADLSAVKVVTLSGGNEELGDTWKQELTQTNEDVKRAIQIRELAAAFADEEHDLHDAVKEEWASLSIHQRMARARKMDAAKKKPEPKAQLTDADRKAVAESLKHVRGAERIRRARELGIQ
ncbi:hypothetical protein [Boseongicola sp. H5]|uniref:hypothetical protein n=1 Tax=Boseongicola sp. H5 TaxID=2763261 RepID=UPI001D0B88B9|nr:hypothetical protein [Boseongicola sp. H5]